MQPTSPPDASPRRKAFLDAGSPPLGRVSSATVPTASTLAPPRDPEPKLAFAMVGLPARGKSTIARKIVRYLNWLGHSAKVFNVGRVRRKKLGERKEHSFFDPDNHEARAARFALAQEVLDEMVHWFAEGGQVAVFDATNTTRHRRQLIIDRCRNYNIELVFIETICDSPEIIEEAIRETKLHSPDYAGVDPEEAVRDFRMRIANYRRAYEPLDDESLRWIKVVEDKQLVINRVDGDIEAKIIRLLLSIRHRKTCHLWLTRHGESQSNVDNRVGGDTHLSPRGTIFAQRLAKFLHEQEVPPRRVWTSSLRRTIETAAAIGMPTRRWRALDEIDAGICDGMSYDEIRATLPDEERARREDKLNYRYPRGESYLDLIARIEPVVIEIERSDEPLVIVGHQAALRVLYGYLIGEPADRCPHLELPLHQVTELCPTPQGHRVKRHQLGPVIETTALASSRPEAG